MCSLPVESTQNHTPRQSPTIPQQQHTKSHTCSRARSAVTSAALPSTHHHNIHNSSSDVTPTLIMMPHTPETPLECSEALIVLAKSLIRESRCSINRFYNKTTGKINQIIPQSSQQCTPYPVLQPTFFQRLHRSTQRRGLFFHTLP